MPLTISAGLTKKVGLPDYGSLGASCHVEFEADAGLLHEDLEGFHSQVRRAYVVCREAVQEELARQQSGEAVSLGGQRPQAGNGAAGSANGQHSARSSGNGSGSPAASQKQRDYINQLARQIHGLGVRRLDALSEAVCGKPVAGLSSLDASGLIDCLKAIKSGEINLDNALRGAGS